MRSKYQILHLIWFLYIVKFIFANTEIEAELIPVCSNTVFDMIYTKLNT